ncbi:CBS domain-containing protein [Desulforhopalus sp. IMCC35007]|uniref:CBS domain-containing protein n=1 Tax=Desulforhopalus sp. IMCC35007 TaxID=2569543 RepID=UPI0010ADC2D3|nr:CBS domain-containing protein [Desulforhopalus sp. IMCC35007]TKB10057.1 CBS domain-containing protein [Desulforhopalus sp. IMCC35007]
MLIATTHKNTDFDALASVIGATLLYPGCIGVVPKMTNKNVERFLSTHKTAFNLVLPNEIDHSKVKKLVVLDTDQWHRLDRMSQLRHKEGLEIDLWDHHMTGKGDIEPTWSTKEHIGSTVTLLVREMRRRNLKLTPLDSTVMLIGLYEDTGHLSFPSTTAEDAMAAAFLLENKADLNVANFFLNPPYEETHKEILFEMMKATEKRTINGHPVGFNCVQLDKKVPNLAAVVAMYRKIVNVDALFVIFISEDTNTVIGRSGVENIHVGEIMLSLGGGGHAGAGSATIKAAECTADLLKEKIVSLLSANKGETASISDIMSFPVVTVPPETTMREIQSIMVREKIRGILVMEDDEILGITVLWDLKRIKKERQWESPVKAFMARDVITITPLTSPTMAARIMIENDVGYLPVIEDKKPIGIVTRTDILTYYYDLLPE